MGIAKLLAAEAPQPPRPASPKLGDFSRIFNFCLELSLDRELAVDTPAASPVASLAFPTAPRPSTPLPLAIVPFTGSFFHGLDLSAIDQPDAAHHSPLTSSSALSDDDNDLARLSPASDLGDNTSVTTASPPLSYDKVASRSDEAAAAAKSLTFVGIPLLDAHGLPTPYCIPIRADLPADRLNFARFWSSMPRPVQPNYLTPMYLSTKQSKIDLLETRLFPQYQLDLHARESLGALAQSPIHVFVDLSNIVIGFYDRLRLNRGIPLERKVKAPPFFFDGLCRLLERGRPTAKKVIAGSAVDNTDRANWPLYMREAEAAGYEMNILNRVTKTQLSPPKRQQRKRANRANRASGGWTTSDVNSSDDAMPAVQTKQGEQAVDEILHLKMCHSFLDHKPATIVLATGDAAEAEFSDGFLKHVERAIGLGWCVELLAWNKGISQAWRDVERRRSWGALFRIVELDEFAEELFAAFIEE